MMEVSSSKRRRRGIRGMMKLPFIIEDSVVENPPKIFKTVKYCAEGKVEAKITKLLENGGAKQVTYPTISATHMIVGDGAEDVKLDEAADVFDLPVVDARWVAFSVRAGKLLPTYGFEASKKQLFSSLVVTSSGFTGDELNVLWSSITFYGGQFRQDLTTSCTHLVANTTTETDKYRIAKQRGLKIICCDWVTDSLKAKSLQDEAKYDPEFLVKAESGKGTTSPPKSQPTSHDKAPSKVASSRQAAKVSQAASSPTTVRPQTTQAQTILQVQLSGSQPANGPRGRGVAVRQQAPPPLLIQSKTPTGVTQVRAHRPLMVNTQQPNKSKVTQSAPTTTQQTPVSQISAPIQSQATTQPTKQATPQSPQKSPATHPPSQPQPNQQQPPPPPVQPQMVQMHQPQPSPQLSQVQQIQGPPQNQSLQSSQQNPVQSQIQQLQQQTSAPPQQLPLQTQPQLQMPVQQQQLQQTVQNQHQQQVPTLQQPTTMAQLQSQMQIQTSMAQQLPPQLQQQAPMQPQLQQQATMQSQQQVNSMQSQQQVNSMQSQQQVNSMQSPQHQSQLHQQLQQGQLHPQQGMIQQQHPQLQQMQQSTQLQAALSQPNQQPQQLQSQPMSHPQQQPQHPQQQQPGLQMHIQQQPQHQVGQPQQQQSVLQSQLQPQQVQQLQHQQLQGIPLQNQHPQQVMQSQIQHLQPHHQNLQQQNMGHPQNQGGLQGHQIIQQQQGMTLQRPPQQQGHQIHMQQQQQLQNSPVQLGPGHQGVQMQGMQFQHNQQLQQSLVSQQQHQMQMQHNLQQMQQGLPGQQQQVLQTSQGALPPQKSPVTSQSMQGIPIQQQATLQVQNLGMSPHGQGLSPQQQQQQQTYQIQNQQQLLQQQLQQQQQQQFVLPGPSKTPPQQLHPQATQHQQLLNQQGQGPMGPPQAPQPGQPQGPMGQPQPGQQPVHFQILQPQNRLQVVMGVQSNKPQYQQGQQVPSPNSPIPISGQQGLFRQQQPHPQLVPGAKPQQGQMFHPLQQQQQQSQRPQQPGMIPMQQQQQQSQQQQGQNPLQVMQGGQQGHVSSPHGQPNNSMHQLQPLLSPQQLQAKQFQEIGGVGGQQGNQHYNVVIHQGQQFTQMNPPPPRGPLVQTRHLGPGSPGVVPGQQQPVQQVGQQKVGPFQPGGPPRPGSHQWSQQQQHLEIYRQISMDPNIKAKWAQMDQQQRQLLVQKLAQRHREDQLRKEMMIRQQQLNQQNAALQSQAQGQNISQQPQVAPQGPGTPQHLHGSPTQTILVQQTMPQGSQSPIPGPDKPIGLPQQSSPGLVPPPTPSPLAQANSPQMNQNVGVGQVPGSPVVGTSPGQQQQMLIQNHQIMSQQQQPQKILSPQSASPNQKFAPPSPLQAMQTRSPTHNAVISGQSPGQQPVTTIVRTQQVFTPQVAQQGPPQRMDVQHVLVHQGGVQQQSPRFPQHLVLQPQQLQTPQKVTLLQGSQQSPGTPTSSMSSPAWIPRTPPSQRIGSPTQTTTQFPPRMLSPETQQRSPGQPVWSVRQPSQVSGPSTPNTAGTPSATSYVNSFAAAARAGALSQTPAAITITPARTPFYGHEPSFKAPPNGFLVGCVFWAAQTLDSSPYAFFINKFGGEIVTEYNPAKVTHILCKNQKFPEIQQVLRDGKRLVTLHWLSDTCLRKVMAPPFYALHLPTPLNEDNLPLKGQSFSVTGFDRDDRDRVVKMLKLCGADYTCYFTKLNKGLISCRNEGHKFNKAREWKVPIVNIQFLNELLLGNQLCLQMIHSPKYQHFTLEQPFRFEFNIAPHLMAAWKTPIRVSNDILEKVKKRPLEKPDDDEETVKRQKLCDVETKQMLYMKEFLPGSDSTEADKPQEDEETKTDSENKSPPVIVFTGFCEKFVTLATEKIIALGGRVATDVKDASHLVAWQIVTAKLYTALCRVKYIVGAPWLRDCFRAKRWLDEGKYVSDIPVFENYHKVTIQDVLKKSDRHLLFKGLTFFLTPGIVGKLRLDLMGIIETAGGQIDVIQKSLTEVRSKARKNPRKYIIITNMDDFDFFNDFFYYKPNKPMSIFTVLFIYNSVADQKVDLGPAATKKSKLEPANVA